MSFSFPWSRFSGHFWMLTFWKEIFAFDLFCLQILDFFFNICNHAFPFECFLSFPVNEIPHKPLSTALSCNVSPQTNQNFSLIPLTPKQYPVCDIFCSWFRSWQKIQNKNFTFCHLLSWGFESVIECLLSRPWVADIFSPTTSLCICSRQQWTVDMTFNSAQRH